MLIFSASQWAPEGAAAAFYGLKSELDGTKGAAKTAATPWAPPFKCLGQAFV